MRYGMLPTSFLRLAYRLKYRLGGRPTGDDVDYALTMTRAYLDLAQSIDLDLSRADILELGPGLSFAAQLVLASHGARVAVADPFLVRWDQDYHPRFYREFRAKWTGPAAAIDKVIDAGGYPPDVITCIQQPAERLRELKGRQFDLIISNAVLEHVSDLPSVCRMLAGLTKPGGINSHQVDFRDHLNRARPLEFLLRSDLQFLLERTRHPSQGNRIRHSECINIFSDAGFSIDEATPNCFADDAYLNDFLPRLRSSRSRYREWPASDLQVLSTSLRLRQRS
jgi:SAM-dependent methyltransferase